MTAEMDLSAVAGRKLVKAEIEFPCTSCGADAFIGYSAGRRKGMNWNGRVKRGERLCTRCFRGRGGERVF